MRAQTTLEFLLLLGAVIGIALAFIGIYLSVEHANIRSINSIEIGGNTVQLNATHGLPDFYFYAPASVYVGNESSGMLLVEWGGNFTVSSLNFSAENASIYIDGTNNGNAIGMYIAYFMIVPSSPGKIGISAKGVIDFMNRSEQFSENAVSFASEKTPINSTSYLGLSAWISQKSANELLGSSNVGELYTIASSKHCAYTNWDGSLYGIVGQCGISASWYYYVGSSECYYGAGSQYMAYCMYKSGIGNLYKSVSNGTYNYNVSLWISSDASKLVSNISQASRYANIVSVGGVTYGNTVVTGSVYGNADYPNYTAESTDGSYTQIPQSSFNTFDSYLNNTLATLAYYNGSRISGASADIAQEEIGKYNSEAEGILTGKEYSDCIMVGTYPGPEYDCSVNGSISFSNITAYIKGYNGNTTLDAGKSIVNVR